MIIVKIFRVNENNRVEVPGYVIEKLNPDDIGFDYTKRENWLWYIRNRHSRLVAKYGLKVRWQVYHIGHSSESQKPLMCYFPGTREGEMLDLVKFGVV